MIAMNSVSHRVFKSISPRYSVVLLAADTLSSHDVTQWKLLADRALSSNPFIEPEFYLPSQKHLDTNTLGILVVLDEQGTWEFAVPVMQHLMNYGNPVPKLRALRTPYMFLDQPLVSGTNPGIVVTCLFNALSEQREWHGLGFAKSATDSLQFELMDFAANVCGAEINRSEIVERPCVKPQPTEELLKHCSSSRRKSLRKSWKRLEKLGQVSFRLIDQPDQIDQSVNEFLRLEASGWKAEAGTALHCLEKDEKFFREMCHQFAKEYRLIFGELLVDQQVVASTCNIQSGKQLFAFKIGWDQNFADCSLGYWSEILLANAIFEEDLPIDLIDSCSDADSYTGKIWTQRIRVGGVRYLWSRRARMIQSAKQIVKTLTDR